jgi:hypothetical protein
MNVECNSLAMRFEIGEEVAEKIEITVMELRFDFNSKHGEEA